MNWNILSDQKLKDSSKIIETLLNNRGIKTKKQIKEFLNPQTPENFSAKELGIDIKEVKKAVKRIKKAIEDKEGIIVYGDYDADGICATAILWETLYKLTKNVLPYIPERVSEGYGLNCDSISKLKANPANGGTKLGLIITVDHGITASQKIEYARRLGIDVIVCDHHEQAEKRPKCSAVIHTDKICATAIAWFLSKEISDKQLADYLALVAIATIADLEPLIGVNRSFVKYGLEELNKTTRPGLLSIFEDAGLKQGEIGTYEVGFIIAPRLNAMGRLEHALESLRLLCTKQLDKAKDLAKKLGLTNKERQLLTEETVRQAKLLIGGLEGRLPKLLVVDSDQYQEGIIGLVAGKLVEEFYRPTLVISRRGQYSKASARSIKGFNIIEAIRLQSDLLVDAGGHPMAAGLTIETAKIEMFKQKLIEMAEEQISDDILEKSLNIDLVIPISLVSEELYNKISLMSPFGLGNPEPLFASKVKVKDFRLVGSEKKHLKMTLGEEQRRGIVGQRLFSAIAFNQGYLSERLKFDEEIELAYNISLNKWNGKEEVELKIKDVRCTA